MPIFAAVETKALLGASFLLFQGQLLWEGDYIDIHGIGVFNHPRRGREGLEMLG